MINRNMGNQDRLLAEALQEGIIILDAQTHIEWWNHAATDLLGLSHDQDKGRAIIEAISNEKIRTLFTDDTNTIEITRPKFPESTLSLRLQPYWQGQQLLIVSDITRTRRLEVMRQDFIANISHELRTPLTVLRGYLELLQDQFDFKQDKVAEILHFMAGQSERMQQLVQDLLLLSRLESDEPDPSQHREVNVAELLQGIYCVAQSLSGDKHHVMTINVDNEVLLTGRAEELYSAFSNIIYNAVNYTPANGHIDICWFQNKNGKHFQVKDTGIGIDQQHISRLTQRFYRVDKGRSSKKGGTGLGLAIVKHVLIRHNGKLTIDSEVGKGSCFTCSFAN